MTQALKEKRGCVSKLPLPLEFAAILSIAGLWAFSAAAEPAGESSGEATCFVEQNYYYPKPGKQDEALATRKEGSEVRASLGLPTGRLFVLQESKRGHPAKGEQVEGRASYLMSLIEYESKAAAERARERLLDSQRYRDVIGRMAELLQDFETSSWSVARGDCKPDASS